MKKLHLKSSLLLALAAVFLSCESDDVSDTAGRFDNLDVTTLSVTAETGQWKVVTFVDDDDDDDDDSRVETADFNGFVFQFNTDGSLLVTKEDLEVTGSWRVYLDDDDDDDDDEMEFEITLSTSNYALQELVEDWYVVEYSDNRIHLVDDDEDDNGNSIDDEVLIFERL